jgi:branched-subunit amino acid transport protein
MALIYIAVPNAEEVYLNLTNVQWHLAILALLILVSEAPGNFVGWIFDCAMLLLFGLSGPFSILLSPIALYWCWINRSRTFFVRTSIIISTAFLQIWCLLATATQTRSHAPLGASILGFCEILLTQVFLGGILGRHLVEIIYKTAPSILPVASLCFFAIGITLIAYSVKNGSKIFRSFLCFSVVILIAALVAPQVTMSECQWDAMKMPGGGGRYFLIPILAWIMALLTVVRCKQQLVSTIAMVLLCSLGIGVISDWKHTPHIRNNFYTLAQEFDYSTVGTKMTFPINPEGWSFTLIKR